MYQALRPLFFSLPTETSHHMALGGLSALNKLGLSSLIAAPAVEDPLQLMGIRFPNRVGLAAGLDKDGRHIDGLAGLGFGFIEIGTVTPRPQSGNAKPRLFRLPSGEAIINRMGFNNLGVEQLVESVSKSRFHRDGGVIGINIGKNVDTPVADAVNDYLFCMRKVYSLATYITINLSSPNTPGLRDLQFGDPLKQLLNHLVSQRQALESRHGRFVPMVVKIAPDMSDEDIGQVAQILLDEGIDGVIATNTTVDKTAVSGLAHGDEQGGLSGRPLSRRSTEVIRVLSSALGGGIPVIGVGGILDGENACEKIDAGASLVQIYSGLIYRGPALVNQVAEAIKQK